MEKNHSVSRRFVLKGLGASLVSVVLGSGCAPITPPPETQGAPILPSKETTRALIELYNDVYATDNLESALCVDYYINGIPEKLPQVSESENVWMTDILNEVSGGSHAIVAIQAPDLIDMALNGGTVPHYTKAMQEAQKARKGRPSTITTFSGGVGSLLGENREDLAAAKKITVISPAFQDGMRDEIDFKTKATGLTAKGLKFPLINDFIQQAQKLYKLNGQTITLYLGSDDPKVDPNKVITAIQEAIKKGTLSAEAIDIQMIKGMEHAPSVALLKQLLLPHKE